jgi:hypothetical protein
MTVTVHTMKYHQPGWSLDLIRDEDGRKTEYSYMVWAPQTQEDVDRMGSPNPPRDHWAANIQVGYHQDEEYFDLLGGGHWQGASFDEVTHRFPARIRTAFRQEVEQHG